MWRLSKIKLLLDMVEDARTLAADLKAVAEDFCSLADSIKTVADAMFQPDAPAEETAPVKAATPAIPPPPTEKPITLEQVRTVLADKSQDGKTNQVRELLLKYGAPKLSGVDPQHYKALLADAEVL